MHTNLIEEKNGFFIFGSSSQTETLQSTLLYTHTYAFACFLLHIAQKDENRKNSKVNIMYKSNCKVQSLSPISAVILAENTFEK